MPWSLLALLVLVALPALAVGPARDAPGEDEAYRRAVALVEKGDYGAAVPLLESVVSRFEDADAFSRLGFALRKSGDLGRARIAYDKALELDPAHVEAREYRGKLFLQLNRPDAAERELAELERLCPRGCEALDELRRAIAEWRAKPR